MFNNSFGTMVGCALALSLSFCLVSHAADTLEPLEQQLFSTSFANETPQQRLNRIETSVFGEAQQGSPTERTARLLKLIPVKQAQNSDAASEQASASNSSLRSLNQAQSAQASPTLPAVARDATDYPTVSALEREVFGRDFTQNDIHQRLTRLEKKVFGQPYPQLTLADRVDKLLAQYPHTKAEPGTATVARHSTGSVLDRLPNDGSQFVSPNRDVYTKIAALEQKLFNGATYPNGLLTERLDRLESQQFGHTFSGESIDTRTDRLLSRYEQNNRTASQSFQPRPGFQSRPAIQSSGYPTAAWATQGIGASGGALSSSTPVNIQIGSGVNSSINSSMLSQFSPQMQALIASDLAPGMMSSTTTSNNGFQTYGTQSIQNYNYYGLPGTSTQSQTTTTVIQPNGSQTVYSYPGSSYPGYSSGMTTTQPAPAYIGAPDVFQGLNQLEASVYGAVNTVEPVPTRLSKLEATLMGQMYPQLPDAQRLGNLQKTYRIQAAAKMLGKSKTANITRGLGSLFMGVPLTSPMGQPGTSTMMPGIPGYSSGGYGYGGYGPGSSIPGTYTPGTYIQGGYAPGMFPSY